MDTDGVISAVLGLVSGAILTYLAAILKFRKDLEAEYDKDLRERRIKAYLVLWNHLRLLARYDRPEPLTPSMLQELSISMRDWYFDTGGLYLSEGTRRSYFDLKAAIQEFVENPEYRPDEELNSDDSRAVLQAASLLRAQLTKDVGTRKSSPIADS